MLLALPFGSSESWSPRSINADPARRVQEGRFTQGRLA
jgi:hypothetical protein